MKTSRLFGPLALALAAFTAACGGGDGASGPSFDDSVSTADAVSWGDDAADYASSVASAMNFGGPSVGLAAPSGVTRILARPSMAKAAAFVARMPALDFAPLNWRSVSSRAAGLRLAPAEGCTFTQHGGYGIGGDPVDDNANGIPDDFGYKYECKVTDSLSNPDTVFTQFVTQEISVKENFSSLYGMSIRQHIFQRQENDHGDFGQVDVVVEGASDIRSNKVTDVGNFAINFRSSETGVEEFENSGQEFSNSFTPISAIALGSDIPNGSLVIGGRAWDASTDGPSLSFSIKTTTPLAYSASCAAADTNPPFTAGQLKGQLNADANSASFTVDFPSCGTANVSASGGYDELPAAAQP